VCWFSQRHRGACAKSQSFVGGVGSRKDTEVHALRRRVLSGVLVLAKTQRRRDIKVRAKRFDGCGSSRKGTEVQAQSLEE
jgi:hypothetical protein